MHALSVYLNFNFFHVSLLLHLHVNGHYIFCKVKWRHFLHNQKLEVYSINSKNLWLEQYNMSVMYNIYSDYQFTFVRTPRKFAIANLSILRIFISGNIAAVDEALSWWTSKLHLNDEDPSLRIESFAILYLRSLHKPKIVLYSSCKPTKYLCTGCIKKTEQTWNRSPALYNVAMYEVFYWHRLFGYW